MTPLETIKSHADAGTAEKMAAYHKVERTYLGVSNLVLNDLAKDWRGSLTLDERLNLADQLWKTNIHEARIAAGKLLTQARIKPDIDTWSLITSWVPEFDAWAIADQVSSAGGKRLTSDPTRLDEVETWTTSEHLWTKRAALVITLPWTKQNHPSKDDEKARDRILGWAASYVTDPNWFIQKSVAWWVRELSKHDAPRARAFLDQYGETMKPFARNDAARHLSEVKTQPK